MGYSLQVMNHEKKTAEWSERISRCRSSGMTVRAWCAQEGNCAKTCYYWQRKIFETVKETEPEFAILRQETRNIVAATVNAGRFSIKGSNAADTETLASLFHALGLCPSPV